MKGEIACYKQFLLFPLCFPQLYIFSVPNVVLCGNELKTLNATDFKQSYFSHLWAVFSNFSRNNCNYKYLGKAKDWFKTFCLRQSDGVS